MFLLMGDTTLESNVDPEHAALPVSPVQLTTDTKTRLFTSPTLNANTIGSLPERTLIQVVGLNDTRDWLEVLLTDGSRAWLERSATAAQDADLLEMPVTFGENLEPRYGPMQSFYFTTGPTGPNCNEAPDALVVQTPDGMEVAFNVNNLDVTIGSTVAFTTVTAPDGSGRKVMIVVLFEGEVTIELNGEIIHLTEPGQAFAVTVNEDGLIDENSDILPMQYDPVSAWVQNACLNAINSGIFEKTSVAELCGADLTYYSPEGFVAALGTPTSLPLLGRQPAVTPRSGVTAPPFTWPQITRPESGTILRGGGSHLTIWTATPGAVSYRLEIFPDSTNLEGRSLSYLTSNTQYDISLNDMPSREFPGWGYFMRAIPLNGSGAPMAPVDQAPLTWVVRIDADRSPPSSATEEPCYEIDGVCIPYDYYENTLPGY